ncbi:hypothetical protein DWZ38_10330 [Ruminococcus sp. AF31-8BH]|nr:hypothetical protein DWZ38_10330 [Ruminococcus sp. AF31-8BH]
MPDFSYAALSSIGVATATPHSSVLHMRKSSCVNAADTSCSLHQFFVIKKSDRNTRALPLTLHSVNRVNCNIPCWEMQEGMLALYRKNNRLRIRMEKAIIRRTGMRMWSGKELVRLWVEKFLNWKQKGFVQKGR